MIKVLLVISLISSTPAFSKGISFENSYKYLMKNIHPKGTKAGVVVASPSKREPNYFYHWVRDAALVMNTVFDLYLRETNFERKADLKNKLLNYAKLVKNNQEQSGFDDLGEPKYNIDGTPFTGPWGRPQNDGPALRAITFIRLANHLIQNGEVNWVKKNLYSSILPADTIIKTDLEYISHRFNQKGFDYWEEIRGLHFSTAMAQRKALLMGSELARALGDTHASSWYFLQAKNVERIIERFWNPSKGFVEATIDQEGGFYKSQLDISSILGVHHGAYGNFFGVDDERIMRTVSRIEESFDGLYSINNKGLNLGVAIGRYPEDTYDGYHTNSKGHAWFLATFAMAEYHLRLARNLNSNFSKAWNMKGLCKLLKQSCNLNNSNKSKLFVINGLRKKAQKYFARADYHSGNLGHMSEQMNRYSGYMEGAKDLTWSYASHLSALMWR